MQARFGRVFEHAVHIADRGGKAVYPGGHRKLLGVGDGYQILERYSLRQFVELLAGGADVPELALHQHVALLAVRVIDHPFDQQNIFVHRQFGTVYHYGVHAVVYRLARLIKPVRVVGVEIQRGTRGLVERHQCARVAHRKVLPLPLRKSDDGGEAGFLRGKRDGAQLVGVGDVEVPQRFARLFIFLHYFAQRPHRFII